MLAPLSWLRDFAPFEDAAALAAALDDLGLVVEGMARIGEGLEEVVVARVVAIDPIAGADRIRLVTVDAGDGPVGVVCGAWNFAVSDLVPLARVGAVLANGAAIGRRRVKGVTSEGMLCSGQELGLSDDASGILVLGADSDRGTGSAGGPRSPGTPVAEALGIRRDVVFDLAVPANRPDAMSMAGVARDAAARLGLPFALGAPELREGPPKAVSRAGPATLAVDDPDLCPRLTARVLTDVVVAASPEWLAGRLVLAGMRPVNSVVDASNYAMLALGQPTHPYDLERLGGRGLSCRRARPGEVLVTLDGQERILGRDRRGDPTDDCLICDAAGDPVGLAGIMGGAASEISAGTATVLLEAAYFDPMAIARTSKRLGLRTEASARFERGCDPEGIERASALVCGLVEGATTVPGTLDVSSERSAPSTIRLRTGRLNALLGTDLGDREASGYLESIGFGVEAEAPGRLEVTPPSFRPDVSREADLVEEVARHHGYSRIPRRVTAVAQVGTLTPYQSDRRILRRLLASMGAHEAWTPTLLGPDDHARAGQTGAAVEVDNPLVREESCLRRSLLPGLLAALRANHSRRQGELRMFEVGHTFEPPPGEGPLPEEVERVSLALAGRGDDAGAAVRAWRAVEAELRLERVDVVAEALAGLHPSRSARLVAAGEAIGSVGEVDPAALERFGIPGRVGWLDLDLARLLGAPRRSAELEAVSRFPSSDVDLAFAVDDAVPAADVEATLAAAAGGLLEDLALFDVYRGAGVAPGSRSLAFRLRFCSHDHTLTDEEVAMGRRGCIEAVESAHGARLRG